MSGKLETKAERNANLYGGEGHVVIERVLDKEKLNDKCGLFAKVTIEPKSSLGYHVHTNETETYHILSGEGIYNDNGTEIPVKSGDTLFCKSGNGHGLVNTQDSDLVFMALIILD